jgi:hypothetical protein
MRRTVAWACVAALILVASGFPSADLWARSRTGETVVSGFSRTGIVVQKTEMTRVPQFENDRATSWRSVIPAHTESTLHRHDRFRTVIGIVGGDLTTVDATGRKTVTRYETGKAYWQAPMPRGEMHKDVNATDNTIELVVVEMK